MHEAKLAGAPAVTIWGTGKPRREFLFVDDLADACVYLLKNYSDAGFLNIGTGQDMSIAEFARAIAETVGYKGDFTFDASRPDGAPQKLLDVSKLAALGWRARTKLRAGLAAAYADFRANGGRLARASLSVTIIPTGGGRVDSSPPGLADLGSRPHGTFRAPPELAQEGYASALRDPARHNRFFKHGGDYTTLNAAPRGTHKAKMTEKIALITGITGQDGAYLAELLLSKGYVVHGIKRRSSSFNTARVDHLYHDPHENEVNFAMHYGDMTDATNLIRIIQQTQPTEIYNLAAQSHVQVSFETPEYTANADALGPLRLLEAIRILGLQDRVRFYQASTSELYGEVREVPQRETTPFYPRSPYGVAKLYAYWITVNYREAYGFHASNGILFNHEGPTRGETFVTRKITQAVAAIEHGRQDKLYLGNLDAERDWGHARDYVDGMWMILQQDEPDDYVLATGEKHSVREFVEKAFAIVGKEIAWQGSGVDEKGLDIRSGRALVEVDPRYFRPTEVDLLLGDPSKARQKLGWKHRTSFDDLVKEMVAADLAAYDQQQPRRVTRD